MSIQAVVQASEELVRVTGKLLPSPRLGAVALALALGRVCMRPEVDLEGIMALIRLSRDGETIDQMLVHAAELRRGEEPKR